jgi:molecular chaperone DnaK
MRNNIDYGIDLGTTNSAIARMENGVPTIKKSDVLKDTIPSCVQFNKRKDVLVGDPAFGALKNDAARALKTFEKKQTNIFLEFKRTMGTTHTYESANMNRAFSSEELSAEVLKKLNSLIQDENISSIVITVPAKFLNPQIEATAQAAKLAGFKQVQLLQEPVAAATAYRLGATSGDGFWLVFDFGGGTFDAALVRSEEGILSVKDTEGDNWLGGKNLDEAIVDQIIIPYLAKKYAINFVLSDPDKKEMLRAAVKFFAEDAKNQMSFKDTHPILTNLGDLPFEDENGEEPEIDISITQADMKRVCGPIFQKAIDITKDLLKRNNLKEADINSLILVGGPTYSPVLRQMLKEQITEKVDTSVDPMTVVAKGAALFASTIPIRDEIKKEIRDETKLQLDLTYEATSVETEELITIRVLKDKSSGQFPDKVYSEIVRSDGGWSSARTLISERASLVNVLLNEGRSNSFEIRVFNEQGDRLECEPNQFNILQGIGGLDSMMVLPYFIGIERYFQSEDKNLFELIPGLEKNKPIRSGLVGSIKKVTRNDVRPGIATDIIRIPVYQGDYGADKTDPALNNLVKEIIITGEDLPAFLPAGSDVEITVKVNSSQMMHFSAYFPVLEHTIELDIDIKKAEPPTEKELKAKITDAKQRSQKVNANDIHKELDSLESQLENEKGSADGKLKILDGLRKELLKLDKVEQSAEWPTVEKELKEAFYQLEDLIKEIKNTKGLSENLNMGKVESHIQDYRSRIEYAIQQKNIKEAKELTKEILVMDYQIRNTITGNEMDVQFLYHLNNDFHSYHWTNPNKARQLINQGLQMAADGKTANIRSVLAELFSLMPEIERPDGGGHLGGKD